MSYMDEAEMEKTLKKLRMYKNSLDLIKEDMERNLTNLEENYDTSNKKTFVNKSFEYKSKNIVIEKLFTNNIYVLDKNLENYRLATKTVVDIFKNI